MVAREACPGRGLHSRDQVQPAAARPFKGLTWLWDVRRGVPGPPDSPGGNATRSAARNSDPAIQVIARCHARRAPAPLSGNRGSLSLGLGFAREAGGGDEVAACAQWPQAPARRR